MMRFVSLAVAGNDLVADGNAVATVGFRNPSASGVTLTTLTCISAGISGRG